VALAAAGTLMRLLAESGFAAGRVVDLGCGSGVLAARLEGSGYHVLGIDLSPEMVALARERAPAAGFRVGSCLDAEIPPCCAVAAVGEVFSYLADSRDLDARLAGLFQRAHAALLPGGVFLFDVAGPGRYPASGVCRAFWEGDGWTVLVEAREDRAARTRERRIVSFVEEGGLFRRAEEVHLQHLYTWSQLASSVRRAGFRVRPLRGYDGLPLAKGCLGFLARGPATSRSARGPRGAGRFPA